jgi:tRNA A37 threonylcarbamoyladenosine dehydratase
MSWTDRTELLIGKDNLQRLNQANVLVVGLGGVGASAAEQIARSGVGKMTIVDADVVDVTNINRQLPAMKSTIGKPKAEIVGNRLKDINPELELIILAEYLRDQRMIDVLDGGFDFVVDAIDTLAPKVYLIYHCIQKGIPIVSSMGSGGKTDPALVNIADISKTHHCQLARMVRKRLHKLGVKKGVKAVYSPEEINKDAIRLEESTNKKSNVGTISYMPNVFGCFCASVVIRELVEPLRNED